MARAFSQLCAGGARLALKGALTLGSWTLWLGLSLLLLAQAYIASKDELQVPTFVQRALLERLAASGVHITFGHTLFDPSGRVIIENAALTLDGFEEPIATARAIYARIDPWALAVRRFEPLEIRVTGMNVRVPAMLSASGRADDVIQDLDAAIVPDRDAFSIEYLHCHVGSLAVSIQGKIRLGALPGPRGAPLPVAEFFARNYVPLIRRCAAAIGAISAFDQAGLRVRLEPAAGRGTTARTIFIADGVRLSTPVPLRAGRLHATGRWSVLGEAPDSGEVFLSLADIDLPGVKASAQGIEARVEVGSQAGKGAVGDLRLPIKSADLSCAGGTVDGLEFRDAVVALAPTGPDLLRAGPVRVSGKALFWGEPVGFDGVVDPVRGTAQTKFNASVAPETVGFVGARIKRDLGAFVRLTRSVGVEGDLRFDPGWKFGEVSGRLDAAQVFARGVVIDEVRGRFRFDGSRLYAPEAYARIGENFARGSFEEEMATRRYRFLLDGRLRPLDITPWINGAWWQSFFSNFGFPEVPPSASIDLRSCWIDGRQARIFLSVDGPGIVVLGAPFDRVRLTLFSRPQFNDGIRLEVTKGRGAVRGTFTRGLDVDAGPSSYNIDFAGTSNMELAAVAPMLGSGGASLLSPYAFSQPPDLELAGHLSGPKAPGGPHHVLHIGVRSSGVFRYNDFPVEDASFAVDLKDDDVTISQIKAGFAGGAATGRANVRGRGAERRLSFEAALSDAQLDRAILAVGNYSATRSLKAAPAVGSFLNEKASVRLDAAVAANGRLGDPSTFQGSGTAQLQGAGLGEVRVLGLLSDLLRFTALRFTMAHAAFKLNGTRLDFPEVNVTGANSAITAHGSYSIDSHDLDFKARINPFKESRTLPLQFMDAMLAPLAQAFEVQLTGKIEKPTWMFANGPANLLRNLNQPPAIQAPSPLKDR
jgi:hypothetical protein